MKYSAKCNKLKLESILFICGLVFSFTILALTARKVSNRNVVGMQIETELVGIPPLSLTEKIHFDRS